MKFYRLENKEKEGVYRAIHEASLTVFMQISRDGFCGRHPAPWEDSKMIETCPHLFGSGQWTGKDYIFGFSSVEQYRAWFFNDETIKGLAENGISLNLYETNDCFIGNSQMVAHQETLDFIGECDIFTGKLLD